MGKDKNKLPYSPLPEYLEIRSSDIHGVGIFAKEDIPDNTFLGMSHILLGEVIYRTPLGGFINHSDDPNCLKYFDDGFYFIRTKKLIKVGEELLLKYTFYEIET